MGTITVIDRDNVDITNINRQLIATVDTVNNPKVEVASKRINSINPNIIVTAIKDYIDETNIIKYITSDYDYVIDAIDSIDSKIALIKHCKINNINIDNVLELYNYIRSISNIRLHTIIINNNGNVVSEGYILFKLNVLIDDISYNDVINFNLCNVDDKYYISFINEWINRLEYLDNNISDGSYDYFKGILECLIKYISDFDGSRYKLCIAHNKVCLNTIDYYNPINLCIDIIYRDIVNYVRYCDNISSLNKYIDINDPNLMKYVFVYLVLPNEYFELLNSNRDVIGYIEEIDNYESYLLEVEELCNVFIFEHVKRSN